MKVCKELKPWKECFEREISALQDKLGYFEPPEVRLLTLDEYAAFVETGIIAAVSKIKGKETALRHREEFRAKAKQSAEDNGLLVYLKNGIFDELQNIILLAENKYVISPTENYAQKIKIFNHECVHSFLRQRAKEISFPEECFLIKDYQIALRIKLDFSNILRLHLINEGIATYVSGDPAVQFANFDWKIKKLRKYTGLMTPLETYDVGCWYVHNEDEKLRTKGMEHLGERMLAIARNAPATLDEFLEKAVSYI